MGDPFFRANGLLALLSSDQKEDSNNVVPKFSADSRNPDAGSLAGIPASPSSKETGNPNLKRLLALCEYLAAVIRLFIDLGDYAAQKKIDRRLRERAAISQIATNETKTQSDAMCEMARNGVSVKHDSADHHRSVEGSQPNQRRNLPKSILELLYAALKALFKKDS